MVRGRRSAPHRPLEARPTRARSSGFRPSMVRARGSFSGSACAHAATRPGPGSSAGTSSIRPPGTRSRGRGAPAPPSGPPCPVRGPAPSLPSRHIT